MSIRLQKAIADAGITSRRKAERLISEGQVQVNGKIVTRLGTQVDPSIDRIVVNGEPVSFSDRQSVVYALYKPKNCVTTLDDPQGRDTIVNYYPETSQRLFPIGRLDYNAEGLVLLTNDGDLANRISHPRQHVWKKYFVKIKGRIDNRQLSSLRAGPVIDGKKRQVVAVKVLHYINDKTWLEVSLQEGIKHQIKIMFDNLGYKVLKIKRYSIGMIELDEMKPGDVRKLSKAELDIFGDT